MREDGTKMYKMTVYTKDGIEWMVRHAKNPAWFDRFKGKDNYRIVITKGKEVVYSEVE